jgi:hypothetical protein
MYELRHRPAWHKLVPLAGLAVVFGFALWWDQNVIRAMQQEIASTFKGADRIAWVGAFGQLVGAGLVLVDGWLLLLWAPPSRLVGLAIAVVSGYVLVFYGLYFWTGLDLPFSREIILDIGLPYSALSTSVPFLTLFGLIRVAWPLPGWLYRG